MSKRNIGIRGLGYHVPSRVLSNKDLEAMVDTSDEWIMDRTGIRERRIVEEGRTTSDPGAAAGLRAAADAGLTLDDIDLVICATFSGDYICPPTSCIIQHKMGFNRPVAAFDIGVACTGFISGAQVAAAMLETTGYRNALVIGAESCSRFMDYTDRSVCVLFGDGAGAAVIGDVPAPSGFLGHSMGADGTGSQLIIIPAGGAALPTTHEALDQRKQYVKVEGRAVFKFAVKVLGEAVDAALDRAGLKPDDIDLLIPHQANIRIIDAAAERYKIPKERVMCNVDRYGNTSAASVPIALAEAKESGRMKRGDVVAMVAFGAGLTYGATILRW